MQTLYEIDPRVAALVDPETGEVTDLEAIERLQAEMGREALAEQYALEIKNWRAQAEAIKVEATLLTERRKTLEAKVEHKLFQLGQLLGGEKLSTSRCEVSFRRSTAIEIADEGKLVDWAQESGHDSCLLYAAPKVSKTGVLNLIRSGVDVPCAQLVQRVNVGVK